MGFLYPNESDSPAASGEVCTNGIDLGTPSRFLYIVSAGDMVVTPTEGANITFAAVTAGSLIPLRITQQVSGTAVVVALH